MNRNATPAPEDEQAEALNVLDQVRAYIEYQRGTGLDALPRAPGRQRESAARAIPPTAANQLQPPREKEMPTTTTLRTPASTKPSPTRELPSSVDSATTLDDLRQAIGDCTRCKLAKGRTNLVFGVGNPNAKLMFVGEAPGRDEDLRGEPFVGRAGQLLTDIITKGMQMQRADVYIANVVKCRPPENRNPETDEIESCQPFLRRQIAVIQPKVLVALGKFAAQTLLNTTVPISRLRGQWATYEGIPLMPTFHPAYLLHNPGEKKLVWADIQLVMRELEKHAE